jgi:hypothetical protein
MGSTSPQGTLWIRRGTSKRGATIWTPRDALLTISQDYTVYRVYGRKALPIYVGMTCDLDRRLYEHDRRSAWWVEAKLIAVTGGYRDRYAAEAAEGFAIRMLAPPRNISGTDRSRPPARYWPSGELVFQRPELATRTFVHNQRRAS